MDQELADQIREEYCEGVPVVDIAIETGKPRTVIYKVLNNTLCPNKDYVKPPRPKDVVEEFGKARLLEMVDRRVRPAEMKRIVEEETGKEISEAAISWWGTELKIERGKNEVLIIPGKEWIRRQRKIERESGAK